MVQATGSMFGICCGDSAETVEAITERTPFTHGPLSIMLKMCENMAVPCTLTVSTGNSCPLMEARVDGTYKIRIRPPFVSGLMNVETGSGDAFFLGAFLLESLVALQPQVYVTIHVYATWKDESELVAKAITSIVNAVDRAPERIAEVVLVTNADKIDQGRAKRYVVIRA